MYLDNLSFQTADVAYMPKIPAENYHREGAEAIVLAKVEIVMATLLNSLSLSAGETDTSIKKAEKRCPIPK